MTMMTVLVVARGARRDHLPSLAIRHPRQWLHERDLLQLLQAFLQMVRARVRRVEAERHGQRRRERRRGVVELVVVAEDALRAVVLPPQQRAVVELSKQKQLRFVELRGPQRVLRRRLDAAPVARPGGGVLRPSRPLALQFGSGRDP